MRQPCTGVFEDFSTRNDRDFPSRWLLCLIIEHITVQPFAAPVMVYLGYVCSSTMKLKVVLQALYHRCVSNMVGEKKKKKKMSAMPHWPLSQSLYMFCHVQRTEESCCWILQSHLQHHVAVQPLCGWELPRKCSQMLPGTSRDCASAGCSTHSTQSWSWLSQSYWATLTHQLHQRLRFLQISHHWWWIYDSVVSFLQAHTRRCGDALSARFLHRYQSIFATRWNTLFLPVIFALLCSTIQRYYHFDCVDPE